ncbi:hypothetical protein Bbelb_114780 [Branchiostoma belcheri]|nr:hypothetical protein Bbelb_114780 [Branchiostoma belcheri]
MAVALPIHPTQFPGLRRNSIELQRGARPTSLGEFTHQTRSRRSPQPLLRRSFSRRGRRSISDLVETSLVQQRHRKRSQEGMEQDAELPPTSPDDVSPRRRSSVSDVLFRHISPVPVGGRRRLSMAIQEPRAIYRWERRVMSVPWPTSTTNLRHFFLTPTALYHVKIMTVASLEQEIQSPEVIRKQSDYVASVAQPWVEPFKRWTRNREVPGSILTVARRCALGKGTLHDFPTYTVE